MFFPFQTLNCNSRVPYSKIPSKIKPSAMWEEVVGTLLRARIALGEQAHCEELFFSLFRRKVFALTLVAPNSTTRLMLSKLSKS